MCSLAVTNPRLVGYAAALNRSSMQLRVALPALSSQREQSGGRVALLLHAVTGKQVGVLCSTLLLLLLLPSASASMHAADHAHQ